MHRSIRLLISVVTYANLEAAALSAKVEAVQPTHPSDGLWFAEDGLLYSTDFGNNAVRVRVPGQPPTVAVQDARLRWPDSCAEGAGGSIDAPPRTFRIAPGFTPTAAAVSKPTGGLWRVIHQT